MRITTAALLLSSPDVLLLDEPTNGLDSIWRKKIGEVLRELANKGISLLMVTHDTEFAAEVADRCALLFRGSVLTPAEPAEFFSGSGYYAPAVTRMTRGLLPGCVKVEEVAKLLREKKCRHRAALRPELNGKYSAIVRSK